MAPSSIILTRLGPSAPRCSHTEADPGPPLNEKVSGRLETSPTPSAEYAMKKISASVSPCSFLSGSLPVVTVYLSTLPLTVIWWCVTTGAAVLESLAAFGASAPGLGASAAKDGAARTSAATRNRRRMED